MTRLQAWLMHVSNLLVAATGLAYGYMRYFMTPADEFAVVNHPWQPHLQHAHVLFAPLLVFAVGLVWHRHAMVRSRLDNQPRKKSGLGMMYAVFPMVFSGYLLQVSVDEGWRQTWVVVHVATSLVWVAGTLAHQLRRRRSARRAPVNFQPTADA